MPDAIPPAELARQTMQTIEGADAQLRAAIGQREAGDAPGDGQDEALQQITDPLDAAMTRWIARGRAQNAEWLPCIAALDAELGRHADSWDAAAVVERDALAAENLQECRKLAAAP